MVENDSESLQDPADIGKDVKVITKIEYANRKAAEELRNSAAGRIGRLIEPALRPLGFDWKIGTAMIGAFAAKEVFVSQLGIVYSLGESDSEAVPLRDILKSIYNPLTGFCIMLFMLIATPCTATMAVVKKETGAWKWAFIQFIGLTVLAYILTASVHTLGTVFGIGV
jgi:ferrous iron transport protein B